MPITRNEVITAGEMLRPRLDHYGNTRFTLLLSRYDMDTVYVPVFCRMRLPEGIKPHDHIIVKGSISSFRERVGEGQYSSVLEIDADSIVKQEETVMERIFGKVGHVPDRPFFNAYFTGTIDYVSDPPKEGRSGLFRRLQIQVDQEKRDRLPQYIPLQFFDNGRRLPRFDSFNLKRGDTVNVWATLSTPTKVSADGDEQRFRDLNVEDLLIEKRAGNEEEAARAARAAKRAERERARRARRLEAETARTLSAASGEFDEEFPPTPEESAKREEVIRQAIENRQSATENMRAEEGRDNDPVQDRPADVQQEEVLALETDAQKDYPADEERPEDGEMDGTDVLNNDPDTPAEEKEERNDASQASSLFDSEDWDDDDEENEDDL